MIDIGEGHKQDTDDISRAFTVDVANWFYGDGERSTILYEDGSAILDGQAVGYGDLPWLELGSEVVIFGFRNERLNDGEHPAYRAWIPHSTIAISGNGDLINSPTLEGGSHTKTISELEAAIVLATDLVRSGAVEPPPDPSAAGIEAETMTAPLQLASTSTGPLGQSWDLLVAPTAVGFCWTVVPSGDLTGPLSCPVVDDDLLASLAAGPLSLPSSLSGEMSVGISIGDATRVAEEIGIPEIQMDFSPFEAVSAEQRFHVYFGPNPDFRS